MPKAIGNKGKGKGRKQSVANPLTEETAGSALEGMTLDQFKTWSIGSLRYYLAFRKQQVSGSHDVLAAR